MHWAITAYPKCIDLAKTAVSPLLTHWSYYSIALRDSEVVLCFVVVMLTHWGRVTHICVSKLTIIGSDNGLSPGRRQAIIWTNAGILLIRTLGTNFSEILREIRAFSFKKMHFKMSSAKWRPLCLGLNGLIVTVHLIWLRFSSMSGFLHFSWARTIAPVPVIGSRGIWIK